MQKLIYIDPAGLGIYFLCCIRLSYGTQFCETFLSRNASVVSS